MLESHALGKPPLSVFLSRYLSLSLSLPLSLCVSLFVLGAKSTPILAAAPDAIDATRARLVWLFSPREIAALSLNRGLA